MLDHLGKPLIEFPSRKTEERFCVRNHKPGLVESPYEIFTPSRIDTRLAADRTIDLRDNSRGNLDVRNASIINSRCETREIANHSSTKSHKERGSVETGFNHGIANGTNLGECF